MTKLIVPEAILEQHVIALGKTGSGKSSKMRVLAEHALDQGWPVTIVDPKGDWWGLKASADGKKAGYPLVIFGGEHADVPLNPRAGAELGELIATGNRPSLIDLRGWMPGDRTRFFIDFAGALFKHIRGKRWLFIDEVHNFAPKGKVLDPDAGKMLHWTNRLASEGRGLGLNIVAASQRPQKVHNDFLTSCETLIACKVIHKADRDAIKDWVDGCADPAVGKQLLADLANMKRTDAWCWSPEIGFGPERITFPMFRTYDSFKPRDHQDHGKLKGWAEVDLDEVKSRLASVVQEAQANDPAQLKKRIAELERQLKTAAGAGATAADIVEARRTGQRDGSVAGFAAGFANAKEQAEECVSSMIAEVRHHLEGALESLQMEEQIVDSRAPRIRLSIDPPPAGTAVSIHPQKGVAPATRNALEQVAKAAAAKARERVAEVRTHLPRLNGAEVGSGGKRRILTALAQYPDGLSTRKLSILTDISSKGGTWRTYLADLRGNNWVAGGRDLMKITDAGLEALGAWDPLPTGDALVAYWRNRLGDSGKRKIFEAVVDAWPNAISQQDVSDKTGIALSGGTWRTYMAELRGLEIIEGRGELRASEDLFT